MSIPASSTIAGSWPSASAAAATVPTSWAGRRRPSPTPRRRWPPGRKWSTTTRVDMASPSTWGSRTTASAGCFFGLGRLDEALEQYEAARAVFQKLIDTYPPHVLARTRNELSNILINIAEIRRMQGRLAEARANCDKAIAIREALVREIPAGPGLSLPDVRVPAAIGTGQACRRRHPRRRRRLPPGSGVERGPAAIAAGELADVRGRLPRDAVACRRHEGFGRPRPEKGRRRRRRRWRSSAGSVAEGFRAPELKIESSLEPLRSRPDFRLLIMDADFPARPFAPGD